MAKALLVVGDDTDPDAQCAAEWALGHVSNPLVTDSLTHRSGTPVRLLKRVQPNMSKEGYLKRISGVVGVDILIGQGGRVEKALIRKSIPEYDANAVDCVRQWEFQPAIREGRPVCTAAVVNVKFKVQ